MKSSTTFTVLHEFPPPVLERAWRDCLSRVQFPSHFNSPEFFIEPYWRDKKPFAVLAVERGDVVGILTGIHEGNHVTSGLMSRPQVCLDKTADQRSAGDALVRGLLSEATVTKLVTVYSWPWTPLEAFEAYGFRLRQMEGNVVLDLTQGTDALFRQFSHERRRNIRFAIKQGVEVFQATTMEDFMTYYNIYSDWCKRKRKTPFDLEVEKLAFLLTQRNRRLFLARYAGRVVAGNIFRFFSGGLFESARNNSLKGFLHLKPNDLMQWKGIEWACGQGFVRHCLGGAHYFLRRFGGTIVPTYRYQLDRTWLQRYHLREAAGDKVRQGFRKLPRPVQETVRRLLGDNHYVP